MLTRDESRESAEYWAFVKRVADSVRRSRDLCGAADGEFFDIGAAEEERRLIGHLECVLARISPHGDGSEARRVVAGYIGELRRRGVAKALRPDQRIGREK